MSKPDAVQSLLNRLGAYRWVAYVVVLVLIVNGAATFTESLRELDTFCHDVGAALRSQQLTDAQLRDKSLETARSLIEFAELRRASEPQIDFNNFRESSNRQSQHVMATQDQYAARFYGQVAMLRAEFKKRGKSDADLDHLYQYPTNYLGLRAVAQALGAFGEQLPKKPAI